MTADSTMKKVRSGLAQCIGVALFIGGLASCAQILGVEPIEQGTSASGGAGGTASSNGGGGSGGQGGGGGMEVCVPGTPCAGGTCDSAGMCVDGAAQWVRLFGGASNQRARVVAQSSTGEIVTAGEFALSVTVGNEVQTLDPMDVDIYVAHVAAADGNGLQVVDWGDVNEQFVHAMAVDGSGHIVVGGEFRGVLAPLSLTANGTAGYVLRLDSELLIDWRAQVSGPGAEKRVRGVAATASHVYAVGDFDGSILTSLDSMPMMRDAFVVAYEAESASVFPSIAWRADFDGGVGDMASASAVAADSGDNAIVVGAYTGAPTFMGAMPLPNAGGSQSIFVAKITSTGDLVWIRAFGGMATEQFVSDVATDGSDIVLIGYYQGDLGVNGIPANSNAPDAFVMKLNQDGMPLWGVAHPSPATGRANAVAVDGSGNIIIAGDFEAEVSCGAITHQCNGTGLDGFVFKLTRDGERIWTYTAGSQNMNDTFWDVATDIEGNVLLAGEVQGDLAGEGLAGIMNMPAAAGGLDALVARLSP